MFWRLKFVSILIAGWVATTAMGGPVIDPIANVSIPAGKSLTIPITATSTNGRPLTYTVTSSTNRITIEVHTNSPFWKLAVAQVAPSNAPGAYLAPFRGGLAMVTNVGDLTLLLFRDRAPRTVEVFQGLTMSGFFSSNTIFHRVIPNFMIQGGDPQTNGFGGPNFQFDDEFHPRALFSGRGQLAMANTGKDSNGSQFFITQTTARHLDFNHTIFGQLLRGFNVLTNIINTPRDANDRPLRNVIITQASFITNYTDMVITLTGTNFAGVSGTIRVIADDGTPGGRVTNTFTATTIADAVNNGPMFLYPDAVTNLVAGVNGRLTNVVFCRDLEGTPYYWFPLTYDDKSTNSLPSVINGQLQMVVVPKSNYAGITEWQFVASTNSNWYFYYANNFPQNLWPPYDWQAYRFVFGDTAVSALPTNVATGNAMGVVNQPLATFTNGVPNSSATNFLATISWGDDTVSGGTIVTNAAGRKEVRGSHTFPKAGIYPVRVTIESKIGVSTTVVSIVTVPPALTMIRTGTSNTLRWPAWAAEFAPQTHTNLNTTNWTTLTNLPALVDFDHTLTNATTTTNAFFRLRR